MVDHLPEFIDPLALAEKRRQFKGSLSLSKMPRVQALEWLSERNTEVGFELRFEKDGKVVVVIGRVEAELQLQCQCCLGVLPWSVHSPVKLGVVKTLAEADLLPESYEPLLLEEDNIALVDIVQDEILLALPTIPQHGTCEPARQTQKKETAPDSPKRPNPFAVLAELKKSN
jgi:uncharacterized protein